MELLLLVFFCLLTGSEVTFGAENEPKVITVEEGSDVILPCSLNTEDITNKKFVWKKDGHQVFLYDDEDHSNNAGTGQDPQFIGRVSHFPDKLKSGNASITISNTMVADSGNYTCEFPDLQPKKIFHIQLVVAEVREEIIKKPKVITVEEGSDVILPCSLNTKDITNKKFEWKKDGRQVFLYHDENHSNIVGTGQDQMFKGRVSHFPDKLKSGDASITIRNTNVTDRGLYTCAFPNHPEQIFHIVLVVGRNLGETKFITVKEGRDATLPCSLNTEDITNKKFEWKKDGRQVFLYDDGDHSNNAGTGQDQQFIGRVEHFPDKLKSGDASITIKNTKVTDKGLYTCEFPNQPQQIFHIVLFVDANITEATVIRVEEGTHVILPCSLNTTDITNNKFEWKKDGRQVFLYDDENHSNIVGTSQDQQFRGRVKHFPDELKSGNASIIIRNMKVADSGLYTCEFPNQPQHIFHIKLVFGSAPKPSFKNLKPKNNGEARLQCETHGNPQPELRWQDSDGKNLTAEEPQVSKQGDQFYVTLRITVKKTGDYRCVATQEEIRHTINDTTHVTINDPEEIIKKTKFITVKEGRDATLPCSLNTTDITNKKFEWKKDGRQVFLYDDGDHSNNVPTGQDQMFIGRVSHFPDELKSGDASITIRSTKVTDKGLYTCAFPNQPEQIFHIVLVVDRDTLAGDTLETTVIIVEKGSDAILPCSLSTTDITNKTFVWKKDGRQVFLYDEGYDSNNAGTGQDQQFIRRVKHFPDELKSGNASIIIRNMKVTDSGNYTCEFPNQPQHIFHIKLVFGGILKDRTGEKIPGLTDLEIAGIFIAVGVIVAAVLVFVVYIRRYRIKSCFRNGTTDPNPSGNGLPQNPNETDGGAVDETGSQLIPSNGNQPTNEDSRV